MSNVPLVSVRFWDIDPAQMDEEASSVKEHQSKISNPVVNCEKKASHVIRILFS